MIELSINRMRLNVMVGAYEEELRAPQTVYADISFKAAADGACLTDDLADTVDYHALAARIVEATGGGRVFHLIESLASTIAQTCLAVDKRISEATVTVEKPSALPGLAASASATVVCAQPVSHET
ncbi:MAG: dihydroneopterin aldolase [Kiritimatiellae bacterium]|nr:dihydroneopterin aldolase [Kiritimatiellia bacterium]